MSDAFEASLYRALGEQMKTDDSLCREVWSALANVDWKNKDGIEAGYTFRSAAALVTEVRGEGDPMDWYCSGPYAQVSGRVEDALAREGWSFEVIE